MVNDASSANPKIDFETQKRQQEFKQKATAKIRGQVLWPHNDLTHTTVQLYTDEQLKVTYASVVQLKNGFFEVLVETGNYYVAAFVDVNQTAVFDFGDGMGIYGVNDWADLKQEKRSVKIHSGQTVDNIRIEITARLADLNGKQEMVPVDTYRPSKSQMFQSQLELISSGVSGQLSWGKGLPQILFENALVIAYTDASWNYKVAQAKVDNDGQFKLNIQRGKYYLMAIIDKNENNRFDIGDYVGAFGIHNLRLDLPIPIFVGPNQFVEDITVEISGRKSKNGQVVPIKARLLSRESNSASVVSVSGRLVGTEQNFEKALVLAYASPALLTTVAISNVKQDGHFFFSFPTNGEYYLLASVDVDQDDKYSTGDMIGAYGTLDLVNTPPQPLIISAKSSESISDIQIVLTATYGSDGQLLAMDDTPIVPKNLKSIKNGIAGRILTDDIRSEKPTHNREALISVAKTDDFSKAIAIPIDVGLDGSYQVPLVPDDYYVMVVIDLNGDRKAGLNDGVGIFGTRRPVRGKPQRVSVYKNQITTNIDVQIAATYTDKQGNITEVETGHRPEIRIQYGQPNDVYQVTRGTRLVEEWWYWSQGIGFSFESNGPGWRLKDQQEFEPRPTEKLTDKSETILDKATQLKAQLFYSYDDMIWVYSPESQHQPIEVGGLPSVSLTGRLIYQNHHGEIMLRKKEKKPTVFLDRRELATDATISPDGRQIAFARRLTDRGRIFIREIESGHEIPVPSIAIEMGMPAWNRTGELLAYVSTGDLDQNNYTENTRNIYSYDLKSNRIDPISVGPTDDTTPVWSPIDTQRLAFCRFENNKRQQIWLIEFDDHGQPSEKQLTKTGGERPVWLPDGSGLVYEKNGQFWVAEWPIGLIDQVEFTPLKINGQNVFGYSPSLAPRL